MPLAKKRKIRATEVVETQDAVPSTAPNTSSTTSASEAVPAHSSATSINEGSTMTTEELLSKARERQERFRSLQTRSKSSTQKNMKEAALETQRLATDPSQVTALSRRQAIASQKLLKADAEEAGEDFERKRAWDWTIDESERWDKRTAKKEAHRDNAAFQDYRQDARKVYKRQLRELQPNMEGYEKEKMKAIERAAATGGLEIVETDDGELVAVDKDGTFYSSADSTSFIENKPEKAAVDRLVKDLEKAEEVRLKKQRERRGKPEDGDVTYINDKNKSFNQNLARFYNKYTSEIRDSFERGTMI